MNFKKKKFIHEMKIHSLIISINAPTVELLFKSSFKAFIPENEIFWALFFFRSWTTI